MPNSAPDHLYRHAGAHGVPPGHHLEHRGGGLIVRRGSPRPWWVYVLAVLAVLGGIATAARVLGRRSVEPRVERQAGTT